MAAEKFSFTDEQRNTLIEAALKKQVSKITDTFLNRCEDAISEWRESWPVKNEVISIRTVRDGLKNVATNLQKLRGSILRLPEGAATSIMVNWNIKQDQQIGDCAKAQSDILKFIRTLENIVLDVQGSISSVGGISKECEAELITELAIVYARTFLKLPSTTPNGIFMRFIDALSGVLNRPDGKPFIAGKDLVATAIKRKLVFQESCIRYPQA